MNVPAVQDKSGDNHEGEENVEGNRNGKVWETEVDSDTAPDTDVRFRGLVDGQDTHS